MIKVDPSLVAVESAIVARASTDHQGDTVDHQVLALMEWAKKLSGQETGERFVIRQHNVFRDDGVSAYKVSLLERPAMKQFIQAVERGEVRCLFIKGLSRFNRDESEAKMFLEWLDGKGVRVKSLEEGFDSRDRGSALSLFNVHSFLARMESDKKSISVKIGMREKAKKGQWKGGIPPYGFQYNPETKKLEPISHLKPIITEVFELAADGRGPVWIAHHFNETRKWAHADPRMWTVTMIQRMLTRRVYAGDLIAGVHNYRYSRELEQSKSGGYLFGKKRRKLELTPEKDAVVVENTHEAIIPRELFQKVQAQFEKRKSEAVKQRKAPNSRYPLTGILICGICGGPMMHHGRNSEKGYNYYCCVNKVRKGLAVCNQENVRADVLHEAILLKLEEKFEGIRHEREFWDHFKLSETSVARLQRRLEALEGEIQQAGKKIAQFVLSADNFSDAVKSVVTKQLDEEVQRLEAEKKQLQKELLAKGSDQDDLTQMQREIQQVLQRGLQVDLQDTAALRKHFHQWVEQAVLYNEPSTGLHRKKSLTIRWKMDRFKSESEQQSAGA
jgi:site-specific DNA recombinase